jgi:hypothetical protein
MEKEGTRKPSTTYFTERQFTLVTLQVIVKGAVDGKEGKKPSTISFMFL